jgi:hypothetical protein
MSKKPASKRKRKPSKIALLKKRLEGLQRDLAAAITEETKCKLIAQITATESYIRIEQMHRLSGFNKLQKSDILCGAPGLGKRS